MQTNIIFMLILTHSKLTKLCSEYHRQSTYQKKYNPKHTSYIQHTSQVTSQICFSKSHHKSRKSNWRANKIWTCLKMRVEELLKCTSKLRKRPTGSLKKQKKRFLFSLWLSRHTLLEHSFYSEYQETLQEKKKRKGYSQRLKWKSMEKSSVLPTLQEKKKKRFFPTAKVEKHREKLCFPDGAVRGHSIFCRWRSCQGRFILSRLEAWNSRVNVLVSGVFATKVGKNL